MTEFAHDKIKPYEGEVSKKDQISNMFDIIAPRYDFMNRFLSAGIDRSWRRKAIREFKKDNPRTLIDIATGTADMAIAAVKLLRNVKITGIDISPNMLELGKKKVDKQHLGTMIELLSGDSETINFPDNSFDGGMVAFGVRNFQHLEKGLKEILRVLKPGAQLVVLEFSQPKLPVIKTVYKLYMGYICPQIAKWFNQNKQAYSYLNESARAFPDREDFEKILIETGYLATTWKPLSLGICCIYTGRKSKT